MSERKSFKQMVMDNFTGEFNTWDELMNVFDDELAKAKQEAQQPQHWKIGGIKNWVCLQEDNQILYELVGFCSKKIKANNVYEELKAKRVK